MVLNEWWNGPSMDLHLQGDAKQELETDAHHLRSLMVFLQRKKTQQSTIVQNTRFYNNVDQVLN